MGATPSMDWGSCVEDYKLQQEQRSRELHLICSSEMGKGVIGDLQYVIRSYQLSLNPEPAYCDTGKSSLWGSI